MQNFRGKPKWLDGTDTEQTGPVSYKVLVGEHLWKRHVDQTHQKHFSNQDSKPEISVTPSNDTTDIQPVTPPQAATAENTTLKPNETKSSENDNAEDTHAAATAQSQPQPRYPTRKAPQRLGLKRTSVQKSNKNEIFMAKVKNSNCLKFCTQVDPSKTRKTVYFFFSNVFFFSRKTNFSLSLQNRWIGS